MAAALKARMTVRAERVLDSCDIGNVFEVGKAFLPSVGLRSTNWKYSFLPDFHGPWGSGSRVPNRVGLLPHALIGERWRVHIPYLRRNFLSQVHDPLWYSVSVSSTRGEPAQYKFLDQPIDHASAGTEQSALEY